jgi:hypothetical protein
MRKWLVVPAIVTLCLASCATEPGTRGASSAANRPDKAADPNSPPLEALKALSDDWSRWLIGQWDVIAESDLAQFKSWVKGRGRMNVELVLGGQFIVMTSAGQMTELSDEYVQYLKKKLHASDEDIRELRNMHFGDLELRTIEPTTGRIVAYLFDSWRCVAKGTGKREGNREIMEWEWSVAGQGTSVRVTERLSNDRFIVVERYTLPDGTIMQDKSQMIRKEKESEPDKEPRSPGRLPGEV